MDVEREKESMDRSSDSDVVLVTKTEEIQPLSQELKANRGTNAWECPMCTFLNGNASATRCEVCDSKRPGLPSKTRKLSQWLSQPVEKIEPKSKKKHATGAQAAPIEVIDSSDSGDSDDSSVTSVASFHDGQRSNGNLGKPMRLNQGLWSDIYAPKTVDDLCVNKKKVQEISEWLEQNASPHSGAFQKRLLFLCGPPGSGKSTAVRCIARKLGLIIKEWEDNSAAGKLHYERMLREDVWMPQVSGVDDFSDFIHRSSAYAALPVATSRYSSTIGRKRGLPSGQRESVNGATSAGQLILIESWPQSWLKEQSLYDEKLQRIYRHVVDPAGGCHYPVVCIYSDVQGSKVDLDHLSRRFSREVMYSPLTSVININAVTSAQLKKHLTRVAADENCPCSSSIIQKVIDCSNGDIRHAVNMLQLAQNPNVKKQKVVSAISSKKNKKRSSSSETSRVSAPNSSGRDPFLSDFHVVGKLLHGKTMQNKPADERELKSETVDGQFDQIMAASAMPLDRVLGLIHENSIAYFSQVEDLSGALELMSLCEVMVAEAYSGVSSSEAFKRSRDVAQAILMRTVAVTNENPAPKAFRPITRPRTFTAKQRIVSRREEMLVATRGGEHGLQHACTGDAFAFEVEPFLTIMDQVGGPATRQIPRGGTFTMDALSIQEEVDDEIENSDDEW
ncbi:Cell cycle checkpoint protein RAD17 [Phytophthora citrophthora]|uniref:Cell cycle checkpoint protein RAD17 n=1 Tax=Phytophthora citrophthora TaxID=4793 RepID=A0AAD9LSE4_9STRA|nr:Cell cycle checkpoint protein RAD17 [Phytophthora citrophthora]